VDEFDIIYIEFLSTKCA